MYGTNKRGLNSKIHIALDSFEMPVRAVITDGTVVDYSIADELIEGIDADSLLADREYDTDSVIEQASDAKGILAEISLDAKNVKILKKKNMTMAGIVLFTVGLEIQFTDTTLLMTI